MDAEERWLSELEITVKTMQRVLGEEPRIAGPVQVSDDVDAVPREAAPETESESEAPAEPEPEPEVVRRGVTLVPRWEPGVEIAVLPQAYRDVLDVLADAGGAMRAVRISSALGRGESAAKVEGLRGKLKRLRERGWLTEDEPGMFALAEAVRGAVGRHLGQ
ncbi:hypothetical protein [Nonomuraea sp. KM90]|uniref:hypothetical protein n=1 Tax=Nonomuraea sp. KM90 TaxID=3457428 RepID=UPI003FCD7354